MPIKGLSDDVRMPRLGKIHLGYRDPAKNNAPVKTDYFVLPKDHSDYPALVKAFGDKPKTLRVLIPVEDEESWASQYYKCYNMTRGLVCKGDGDIAMRMVDIKTGELPGKETLTVTMREMVCAGKECPEYKSKKCGESMNLRFMLPEIPGIGVWQIDTGSINSILNINSCAKIIKKTFGRIALVPLTLSLEPLEVNNPTDGKKQKVFVINLRTDVTLNQLADLARDQAKTLMLQQPDIEAEYEAQAQRDIDIMWGEMPSGSEKPPTQTNAQTAETKVVDQKPKQTTTKASAPKPPAESTTTSPAAETPQDTTAKAEGEGKKPTRDPATIKDRNSFQKVCSQDFQLHNPGAICAELNLSAITEIADWWDAYCKIWAVRNK